MIDCSWMGTTRAGCQIEFAKVSLPDLASFASSKPADQSPPAGLPAWRFGERNKCAGNSHDRWAPARRPANAQRAQRGADCNSPAGRSHVGSFTKVGVFPEARL